jgi:hypothetical protein
MSWKSLGRIAAAALAACTLAAASPAAAQPAGSRPTTGLFEQLTNAIRQRLAALWTPTVAKGCEECIEQGPGIDPHGSTTTPACEGCGEAGSGIDPNG